MIDISLNFMPAFYHKHIGANYGEGYYFDPVHREEISIAEQKFLYEVFGKFGAGAKNPQPDMNIFIQAVDLVMITQGAEWRVPEDGTVESWGAPWAKLTIDEIAAINQEDAAHHPIVDRIIALYNDIRRHYPAIADICNSKSGIMNIHTPYTTAHQLYGEELFILMLSEPEQALRIFNKLWEIYQAIFKRFAAATGAKFNAVLLGDCSASMLSAGTYRDVVLPMNALIAKQFDKVTYHSCGASTHLLEDFAEIPHLSNIQLGPGTDLQKASYKMLNVHMMPLLDPLMMRSADAGEVSREVGKLINSVSSAPKATVCAWSLDMETPFENVNSLYLAAGAGK